MRTSHHFKFSSGEKDTRKKTIISGASSHAFKSPMPVKRNSHGGRRTTYTHNLDLSF